MFFSLVPAKIFRWLIGLALMWSWTGAWAGSPITVQAKVDKPRATTGDLITYTVTVRHDADLKPALPDFSGIQGFDVLESRAGEPRQAEGQREQDFSVQLRADRVGSYKIPPIAVPFEVVGSGGNPATPGEIRAPEVEVEVQSILRLQGEPTDIRDIKDPVEMDRDWSAWIFNGLNVLLLLLLIYLFWKYRRAKPVEPEPQPVDLPPHEAAFQELEALRRKGLLERGRAREHFFELSEIFRRYLGRRFLFPAPDWTTEEITARLEGLPDLEAEIRKEAVRILKKSDLIKFAKVEAAPGSDEIDPVRAFVTSTREHLEIGLYSS